MTSEELITPPEKLLVKRIIGVFRPAVREEANGMIPTLHAIIHKEVKFL